VTLLLLATLLGCTGNGTTSTDDTDTDTHATSLPVDTGPFDSDGDGVWDKDDCAPDDRQVHPGAEETWYDGTDQDCDGNDADADADGYLWEGVDGGDDCDDTDADIYPGAPETWYDGIDQDCAGDADEHDRDGDGCLGRLRRPWSAARSAGGAHPAVDHGPGPVSRLSDLLGPSGPSKDAVLVVDPQPAGPLLGRRPC